MIFLYWDLGEEEASLSTKVKKTERDMWRGDLSGERGVSEDSSAHSSGTGKKRWN